MHALEQELFVLLGQPVLGFCAVAHELAHRLLALAVKRIEHRTAVFIAAVGVLCHGKELTVVVALRGGDKLGACSLLLLVVRRRDALLVPRRHRCLCICLGGVRLCRNDLLHALPLVVRQRHLLVRAPRDLWERAVCDARLFRVKYTLVSIVDIAILVPDALDRAQDRRVDLRRELLAVLVLVLGLRVLVGLLGAVAVLLLQLLKMHAPLVVRITLRVRLVHLETRLWRVRVRKQVHGVCLCAGRENNFSAPLRWAARAIGTRRSTSASRM